MDTLDTSEAQERFRYYLRDLHRTRHEPSYSQIAKASSGEVSPPTVKKALEGPGMPRWGRVAGVIKGLGGDERELYRLWRSLRDHEAPLGAHTLPPGVPETESVAPEFDAPRNAVEACEREEDLDEKIREQDQKQEAVRGDLAETRERLAEVTAELEALQEEMRRSSARGAEEIGGLKRKVTELERERLNLREQVDSLSATLRLVRETRMDLVDERYLIATWFIDNYYRWGRDEQSAKEKALDELRELKRRSGID